MSLRLMQFKVGWLNTWCTTRRSLLPRQESSSLQVEISKILFDDVGKKERGGSKSSARDYRNTNKLRSDTAFLSCVSKLD